MYNKISKYYKKYYSKIFNSQKFSIKYLLDDEKLEEDISTILNILNKYEVDIKNLNKDRLKNIANIYIKKDLIFNISILKTLLKNFYNDYKLDIHNYYKLDIKDFDNYIELNKDSIKKIIDKKISKEKLE